MCILLKIGVIQFQFHVTHSFSPPSLLNTRSYGMFTQANVFLKRYLSFYFLYFTMFAAGCMLTLSLKVGFKSLVSAVHIWMKMCLWAVRYLRPGRCTHTVLGRTSALWAVFPLIQPTVCPSVICDPCARKGKLAYLWLETSCNDSYYLCLTVTACIFCILIFPTECGHYALYHNVLVYVWFYRLNAVIIPNLTTAEQPWVLYRMHKAFTVGFYQLLWVLSSAENEALNPPAHRWWKKKSLFTLLWFSFSTVLPLQ